jgi:uncharacterized spore protein YtfJ
MDNETDQTVVKALDNWNQGIGLVEKLFSVARPGTVFSEPVTVGEHTVITASEVGVAMGFGYGAGGGGSSDDDEDETEAQGAEPERGLGGGGGGGGASSGRPVAAISIGPEGVRVDPVVDITKVGLAFVAALGALFLMLGKMRQIAGE